MDDEDLLFTHIQRNIALAPDHLGAYTKDVRGNVLYHRWAFTRLRKVADDFISKKSQERWLVLAGLRGTGKTTLLAQLYFHLREQGVAGKDILYVSMDEVTRLIGGNLNDIIGVYEKMTRSNIETLKRDVFLLVDEAHYDKDWAIAQKRVYDRSKRVFMMTTGSSALSLQTNADTARRARVEKLLPLNFPEYLMLKHRTTQPADMKRSVEDALLRSKDAAQAHERLEKLMPGLVDYWMAVKPFEVENFLTTGAFPFAIDIEREEDAYARILSALAKVINEDLPAFRPFDKDTLDRIWKLLLLLSMSERVSLPKLSSNLGLSKGTLIEVLDLLVKSELIYPVNAYGSINKGATSTPKYKFVAPAVKASLLWKAGKLTTSNVIYGKLLEDAVASYMYRLRVTRGWPEFYFDPDKGGADFVAVSQDDSRIVIEVGYGRKDTDQIVRTARKVGAKYSLLVSGGQVKSELQGDILKVSSKVFLSM
jgi:hypothetical protein